MKKVLRALDKKDLGFLTSMIIHQRLDPNKIIPEKGVSLFHLIIGHQSENFAFKVTKLFLRYGGDPNVASDDGVTPIHVASAWGRTRILHLLLVNGGDPWLQDDDRKNAFNYAFEEQEWDAVEMLHYFQQIHSSTYRKDADPNPKFEFNFERILMRKGNDLLEYGVRRDDWHRTSQAQTQTDDESHQKSDSPVFEKIKYFESNAEVGRAKSESTAWRKDYYQTSCEILVNSDTEASVIEPAEEKRGAGRYVSSIHIEAPLKTEELTDSVMVLEKSIHSTSNTDVRSQLFMELQEAVLRRSRQKISEKPEIEKLDQSPSSTIDLGSDTSVINVSSDLDNSVIEDSFVAKEANYLYGVNMSSNSLLRHMSDFATKVMEEIEVSETVKYPEKERKNSTTLDSTYVTCEGEASGDRSPIAEMPITDANMDSAMDNSNESFVSIAEEYKYTDKEEGIVLMEKKLLVTPTVSFSEFMESMQSTEEEKSGPDGEKSSASDVSSAPSAISYASDCLRKELTSFGFNPGPINKNTKKLYLKKLSRLKKSSRRLSSISRAYSKELEMTTKSPAHFDKIVSYAELEQEMMRTFDENPGRKWRGGVSKTSFNYLLLDPRVSLNLPRRAMSMPDLEIWNCFLSSVFYVGKGKRSRPYAHIYEAASHWQNRSLQIEKNGKIKNILEIWSEDLGVICLHVFQNVIPVEAFTREAAMIDAIGTANLKNLKSGEYYGSAAAWIKKNKLKLGVYLLYKAMLIFLNEGERQIRPFDINS